MEGRRWARIVGDWDGFLEKWYAPPAVFLASVALWFIPTWTFVYGFDSLSLSMTVLLSMFLGAANTYAVYVRHDQRVGPMPDRI